MNIHTSSDNAVAPCLLCSVRGEFLEHVSSETVLRPTRSLVMRLLQFAVRMYHMQLRMSYLDGARKWDTN